MSHLYGQSYTVSQNVLKTNYYTNMLHHYNRILYQSWKLPGDLVGEEKATQLFITLNWFKTAITHQNKELVVV